MNGGAKPRLSIPESDYTLSYVRSPGPGGQNVNKVSTACELRFAVGVTSLLDDAARRRLRALAGRRLTIADEIVLEAHRHRSREANRRDAIERLEELLIRAMQEPKVRKPTRPGKAARARRLQGKRLKKDKKRLRARPVID
jgi:ribosome-associated protein